MQNQTMSELLDEEGDRNNPAMMIAKIQAAIELGITLTLDCGHILTKGEKEKHVHLSQREDESYVVVCFECSDFADDDDENGIQERLEGTA